MGTSCAVAEICSATESTSDIKLCIPAVPLAWCRAEAGSHLNFDFVINHLNCLGENFPESLFMGINGNSAYLFPHINYAPKLRTLNLGLTSTHNSSHLHLIPVMERPAFPLGRVSLAKIPENLGRKQAIAVHR